MFVPVCDRPSVAEPTEAQDRSVMETRSVAIHRKMPMLARQLPITGFAHKTRNGRCPLRVATAIARGVRARRPERATPAGSLLSPRVHAAGRHRRHRLSEQGDGL